MCAPEAGTHAAASSGGRTAWTSRRVLCACSERTRTATNALGRGARCAGARAGARLCPTSPSARTCTSAARAAAPRRATPAFLAGASDASAARAERARRCARAAGGVMVAPTRLERRRAPCAQNGAGNACAGRARTRPGWGGRGGGAGTDKQAGTRDGLRRRWGWKTGDGSEHAHRWRATPPLSLSLALHTRAWQHRLRIRACPAPPACSQALAPCGARSVHASTFTTSASVAAALTC